MDVLREPSCFTFQDGQARMNNPLGRLMLVVLCHSKWQLVNFPGQDHSGFSNLGFILLILLYKKWRIFLEDSTNCKIDPCNVCLTSSVWQNSDAQNSLITVQCPWLQDHSQLYSSAMAKRVAVVTGNICTHLQGGSPPVIFVGLKNPLTIDNRYISHQTYRYVLYKL